MTLNEIVARIKAASPKAFVDKVREMIAGLKCEHSVYPATASERWKEILTSFNLEGVNAVGVTLYGVNATAIDRLSQLLKKKFAVVGRVELDQWRSIFVCGKSNEDQNPLVICTNWYPTSREEVKAMNQDASNAEANESEEDDAEDIDLEDTEGDPFA